jgi:hypothetical protein
MNRPQEIALLVVVALSVLGTAVAAVLELRRFWREEL